MTKTMRERLIQAIVLKLKEYDFEYDEEREGIGAEIIDAILSELRTPDEGMVREGSWHTGGEHDPGEHDITKRQAREAFTAMIDHVRAG